MFRGLVEGVYQQLGEDWNLHPAEREGMQTDGALEGQYDRVLRCLERRLAASDALRNRGMRERIRTAVRHVLAPPANADLANHLALLELSRDAEGRNRILTTNFDTLFERAWHDKHQSAIATHAGMAMPQPKVAACTGVLHLHGRLADPMPELAAFDTDLVLTSAEFGDAYLRSGWASRYIYDLVRAYTVVLVGYQADDPPMRYLLEALEADRERYPDLQKVYAFASCEPGQEELVRALWAAKAVEPILYTVNNDDHDALYSSLLEWRNYAEDPTAWRRERLRPILAAPPSATSDERKQECTNLLAHGDACQLLGELSPPAEWLPVLIEKRVFDRGKELPGQWIAKRINDPAMIRAATTIAAFDEQLRWHIGQALERDQQQVSPLRARAWRLMLTAKRPRAADVLDDSWYQASPAIKRGQVDFETRRLVSRILRPRLTIGKAWRWDHETRDPDAAEALHDLLKLEFDPAEHPPATEILAAWPQDIEHEIALFQMLDRALLDAMEEAQDIGLLDGWDRISFDVPSVAAHRQNAHRHGFYPITRALADLWLRIVARDATRARALVQLWTNSAHLLLRRLTLFAYEHAAFSPSEAAMAVMNLDEKMFWGNARVEIMRLLVARWSQFSDPDRAAIETRIRNGEPRDLFPADAFENDEEWRSVHDSSIYRRLKRIELAGGTLSPESQKVIAEIAARHPEWQPSPGDRDDFHVWHEMRSGPDGEPGLLAKIADDRLVREAMRLQRERHFDQGDVWRVFCSADPERALRGLQLEAAGNQWEPEAWRYLIWAANEKGDASFQFTLAGLLLQMPDAPLSELLPAATSWLQRRREVLSATESIENPPQFFPLWDRFADLVYLSSDDASEKDELGDDLLTESLNRPGGTLAWALLDALGAMKPDRNAGFGAALLTRFDRLASAGGRAGLLARVYLAHSLAYLDAVDPNWVQTHFEPRFAWGHPEALPLWRSFANDGVGSARLFNALKPAALAAFERQELSDNEFEGVMSNLLSVALWHQRGEAPEYELSAAEVRRALTVGPASARRNVSWNLWRMMGKPDQEGSDEEDAGTAPIDRPTRWRTIIGPLFQSIWPLDARLRSESTTQNLVLMALETEDAFPEAVEAILDVIVPYELYQLSHSLRLESKHSELVRRYPLSFVRLANALIDPAAFRVPSDLAGFLQECAAADPTVVNDPAYVRLNGLRRQRNA
ncbi:SIR2 family protein [Pseudolabrys sp. FHR47]|uniref:SIR2 family protein n=1 Tax=Pseudolabrys sp. FHR47 TaxID=2562284 RepID=UPI00143CF699|nr:SIR2 family protein [Pseudolabrys sp. FHR47]